MVTVRPPGGARLLVRRTVFLLAGGAVAAAFIILGSALIAPVQATVDVPVFIGFVVLLMAGAGLLPGVREVQVAGAEALLGVAAGSVAVPEPMRWPHRWRTALWTLIHQVAGAITGLLLIAGGLAVAELAVLALGGDPLDIPDAPLRRPVTAGEWTLAVGIVVVTVAVSAALVIALGRGASASAPLLLGPLGEDRLRLSEQRLAQEREHVRLSRDLHDGVGHSLSAISLQAGAARRTLTRDTGTARVADPDRVAETLRLIEDLAGRAAAELDHALAVLRHGAPATGSAGDPVTERRPVAHLDLAALPDLVATHRSHGMDLRAELPGREETGETPAILRRTAYRICAEALANAAKHGTPGPVELAVHVSTSGVTVRASNPMDPAGGRGSGGHGLDGLAEQVDLLGGRLSVGPDGQYAVWHLRATLPTGGGRERRG